MRYLIFFTFITLSFHSSAQFFHTDIRGTSNDTDGGMLQLATPSENHYLRFFSGQNDNASPFIYFSDTDTFRVASGLGDFSNLKDNLTLFNSLGTGSSPTTFVGINNSNPFKELDIRTNHIDDGAEINIGNLDNSHFLRFFSGRQNQFPSPTIYWNDGDSLSFGTNLNVYTERMRITSEGNVGLGTEDPQARLGINLNSTATLTHIDLIEDEDVDYARIRLRNRTNSDYWDIAATTTGDGLLNFFYSGVGDILSIKNNARVGVGNTNPQAKLHVTASGADNAANFDGKVNFTDPILLNGSSGNAGQVLTSSGSSDPVWASPNAPGVGFKAIVDTTFSVAQSGTPTILTSLDELFDNGGNFDPVTGIFTVPSSGVYLFTCRVTWSNNVAVQNEISTAVQLIDASGTLETNFEVLLLNSPSTADVHLYTTHINLIAGNSIMFGISQSSVPSLDSMGDDTFPTGSTWVSGLKIY